MVPRPRLFIFLHGNERTAIDSPIFMTGRSFDKKYFAKVYPDKIDIHESWDGAVIRSFTPSKTYGEAFLKENSAFVDDLSEKDFNSMGIHQAVVFPKGDKVAIASRAGIFVLEEKGFQVIVTEEYDYDEEDNGQYEMKVEYPHIDISPDEKYLVAGSQDSQNLIFENKNNLWSVSSTIVERCSYLVHQYRF